MKLKLIFRIVTALLTTIAASSLQAQMWPAKQVTFVVPFPAGGASDTIGRVVAERLSEELRVPFVVENKSGAGGTLGAGTAAKAAPDGYTFLVATSADQVNAPYLYAKLAYDPAKDFTPVAWLARDVILLTTAIGTPGATPAEIVAASKLKPMTFGSSGQGTTGHIAGEVFKSISGANIQHIPYRGNAPAINDALAGHIQLLFIGPAPSMPHIQAGKLKPIAVASEKRLSSLPDVPTFQERGLQMTVNTWYALMAPAGTPTEIVQKMNLAVNKVLTEPAVIARLRNLGLELRTGSSADLGKTLANERDYWGKFLKSSNIHLE